MRDFKRTGGKLRGLSFHARLTYSVFLLFTLAGLGLSLWLTDAMVGLGLGDLDAYYAGTAGPVDEVVLEGGPALDLPAELETLEAEPMAMRRVLEVTHFHLFSMPVYLMILSHLFMLSRASSRSKTLWILAGAVGVASHVAAPFLARTGSTSSAAVYATSGVLLLLSFLWMCIVPLLEMWTSPTRGSREPARPVD